MAGLGSLPDTILTRSVIIRMRKKAPNEKCEPYRRRVHEKQGHALRDRLAEWTATIHDEIAQAWPEMPEGVTDRPADVWEPLLAVADEAGGHWPERARAACVALIKTAREGDEALTLRVYTHLMPSSDARARKAADGLYEGTDPAPDGPETAQGH